MSAGGLAELLLRSAALLAVVWAMAEAVRRSGASAAMRHLAWMLGFAGLALLPFLSAIVPALPVPILPAETPVAAAAPASAGPAAPIQDSGPSAESVLQILYFAVALALLGRLAAGRVLLARMWRQGRDLGDPERIRLLRELSTALALPRAVRVRISGTATVPMTWGTIRPRILLPSAATGWSEEQWRIVLLHELGHVVRCDSAGRTAAAVICAFYWLNPIAWIAAERMRCEQEHACDDLVLSHGAQADSYARNLLHAARSFENRGQHFAPAMIRKSDLESRVLAIIGDGSRSRAGPRFVLAASVIGVATVSFAAAIMPVAATTRPPSPATLFRAETPAAATEVEPATTMASAAAEPEVALVPRPQIQPFKPAALPVEAVAPAEASAASQYEGALAAYREQKARYVAQVEEYRDRLVNYRADMDQYRRDMARHRQLVAAIRALPDGDPNKIVPPAPVAPVAPVAPTAPVVPPVPPDLHRS